MNKKTKYAMYGGIVVAIASGLYNLFKQSNDKEKDPNKTLDVGELIGAVLAGAAVGAGGGYLIGVVTDYNNSKEKPLNTDILLLSAVNGLRLNKTDKKFVRLNEKAEVLTMLLKSAFKSKLSSEPYRLGSTEKGTALKEKFDIDICLAFKPNSFPSTEEMYFAVEEVIQKYIGTNSIVGTRRQQKSIGVFLEINGVEYKVDVLPKKLTASGKNRSSGYLYVNDESLFGRSSYTKTNVKALNSVKLTETQKKIVVAYKDWKLKNDIPLGSHLLQCLVLDAYECNRGAIPKSFTRKLIMVASYIADHIETITISSIENTNNIVTDISSTDKRIIRDACKKIVDDYAYQPNSIIDAFCVN